MGRVYGSMAERDSDWWVSVSGKEGAHYNVYNGQLGMDRLAKYPDGVDGDDDWPDDYYGDTVTFLIIHPRIVCMRCGNVKVSLADMPYLKKLRASSIKAVSGIGRGA